jgi:hypothetical protein
MIRIKRARSIRPAFNTLMLLGVIFTVGGLIQSNVALMIVGSVTIAVAAVLLSITTGEIVLQPESTDVRTHMRRTKEPAQLP